jgi:hypothetical protein
MKRVALMPIRCSTAGLIAATAGADAHRLE